MYIISKHKDYYDGVAGSTGIDKSIVFERTLTEYDDREKFPEPFNVKKRGYGYWNDRNSFYGISFYDLKKEVKVYEKFSPFIVGFCGKLYIGWKFLKPNPERKSQWEYNIPEFVTDIIYDYDDAKKFLKTSNWRTNLNDDVKYILSYDPIETFRKLNVPYFILDIKPDISSHRYNYQPQFITNPILKDYEFYKVFDAYTTFQEIQMFISGVLGVGEREIIEVEDKYKIGQHGFDKWSFRREPRR